MEANACHHSYSAANSSYTEDVSPSRLGNSMNGTGVSLQDQWARQNIQKIFACCRTFAIISPTDLPLSAAADTDITSC